MRKYIINMIIKLSCRFSRSTVRKRQKREIGKVALFYRICDAGNPKVKPNYITKENCLKNAIKCFPLDEVEWFVIGDNIYDSTYEMILKYVPKTQIARVSLGSATDTFRMAYDKAIMKPDDTLVYFLEDDYLHLENSLKALRSVAEENYADYMTLYDCPDKYGFKNINPFIKWGGEKTRLFLTSNHHWKITNSTTMTMATFVDVLKRDKDIWWCWSEFKAPLDFQSFIDLKLSRKVNLISPIPSLSTHGESAFLAPLIDWDKVIL